MADFRTTIEAVFREESGRIIARLIRLSGSFDVAEEVMQDAFASALCAWERNGIPEKPGAWIMAAAHRKLIDEARKERTRRGKQDSLSYELKNASAEQVEVDESAMSVPDDRLRLMFACCHPAINQPAQIALTLRTLGGLTTSEIAKAFLQAEATLAQRLVRAKRKIQEARIPFEIPRREHLAERLESVQAVIYLIFNEGYVASSGPGLVRNDLCAEAIRLGRLLCELLPNESENLALLGLMLLHDSRRDARTNNGDLVTLEEQDRSLWDRKQITEGQGLVAEAMALGGPARCYLLQAAIAALHAGADCFAQTDWGQIMALYGTMLQINPSPVIALNHAVAEAMHAGSESGLLRIDEVGNEHDLDDYYLFHAARADLLRRLQRNGEAALAYGRAIHLVTNPVELRFLQRRKQQLPPQGN